MILNGVMPLKPILRYFTSLSQNNYEAYLGFIIYFWQSMTIIIWSGWLFSQYLGKTTGCNNLVFRL